jgi:hypothetical protein
LILDGRGKSKIKVQIEWPGLPVMQEWAPLSITAFCVLFSDLREGITQEIVRRDLDISHMAFLIHSLSLILMASLVSPHFQIRFKEYLEIPGKLDPKITKKTWAI